MPYDKKKVNGKWKVYKKLPSGEMGRVFGTHDTEEDANRQIAALYANEKKESGLSIKSIIIKDYDTEN
jgi:hypothetical protein